MVNDFEDLLKSKYGNAWKQVLFLYLEKKAKEDSTLITKINQAMYNGLHSNYTDLKDRNSEVETLAISAMQMIDTADMKKKKNREWIEIIAEKLSYIKHFKIDDLKLRFKSEED